MSNQDNTDSHSSHSLPDLGSAYCFEGNIIKRFYYDGTTNIRQLSDSTYTVNAVYLSGLMSDLRDFTDVEQHFRALKNVKEILLSKTHIALCLYENKLTDILLDSIRHFKEGEIVEELLYILIVITGFSSRGVKEVAASGAIPLLFNLMKSADSLIIVYLSAWVVSNLIGENYSLCQLIMKEGFLSLVHEKISETSIMPITRTLSRGVLSVCRYPVPKNTVTKLLETIKCLISHPDPILQWDAVWCVSLITDFGITNINEAIFNFGIVFKMLAILNSKENYVLSPLTHSFANMTASSDSLTRSLVKNGILKNVPLLLSYENVQVRTDAAMMFGNIISRMSNEVSNMITDEYLNIGLVKLTTDKPAVQTEMIWVFSNLLLTNNKRILGELLKRNVMKHIFEILHSQAEDIKLIALFAIKSKLYMPSVARAIALNLHKSGAIPLIQRVSCDKIDSVANVSEIILSVLRKILDQMRLNLSMRKTRV
ncbi:importin subunit alpha-3-like [Teleopsis dalmanni]|uniref:importin subunit alpha-3-like n=1 Tax=Teleopsis dalmanni TaxID=139649 RepID=UPI0018CDD442|nr:importin subunit alpha-3-like [Teleopsis dalmanni]XP_037928067.1 importin subunit alpha-3-like [Teleopsis dalmanni]